MAQCQQWRVLHLDAKNYRFGRNIRDGICHVTL